MAKRKFICPECRISFTSRKDAKRHMKQKSHKGGVIVTRIEEKVKKVEEGLRSYWYCPICGNKFKTMNAVKSHMKDKKHDGEPYVKSSIIGKKKQEVVKVEEPKKEPPPVQTYCRIMNTDWEVIQNDLPSGITHHVNPANGNHIMKYTDKNEIELDYLFFKYDFVEIEMENADVIFCLNDISSVWLAMGSDLAEFLMVGIIGVNELGQIRIHHSNFDESTQITKDALLAGLSQAPQNNLACLVGVWEAPPTPIVKKTYPQGSQYGRYGGLTGFTSETIQVNWGQTALTQRKFNKSAKLPPTISKMKPAIISEPIVEVTTAHPIYKIDEHFIYCDRVVDYEIYNTAVLD